MSYTGPTPGRPAEMRWLTQGANIQRIKLERAISGASVTVAGAWIVGCSQSLIAAIF
jgi:hypothetical protein